MTSLVSEQRSSASGLTRARAPSPGPILLQSADRHLDGMRRRPPGEATSERHPASRTRGHRSAVSGGRAVLACYRRAACNVARAEVTMRVGAAALLACIGCSSSERAPGAGAAPNAGDAPALTEGGGPSASSDAIADPTGAPPVPRPAEPSEVPFNPVLAQLESQSWPAAGTRCPSQFMPLAGFRLDEANGCLASVLVGCWPGNWMNSDLACFRRADGVIFEGSSSVRPRLGLGWTGCHVGTLEALFASTPRCAEQGALDDDAEVLRSR